ncbi:aminotransferase class I/II-fold pyridoxal phosphate-dependent enzyme [Phycisphaera mikurensis]|uniref:Aminotransferase n=1 Tax=Phycisphaera mikurensis (strain NBRC 102666 / KCTC 22515 / FYK2301M01) TaxID=1142394 RepID=I0ICU9_PHYMF|nr:aminotransferase class I/II-fold pyridoxal phosphate-dependent enzyme [Phycisphaera mikurensis]MBB6443296.1 aspartate/methionine/tyrosine aminotransferase [Phycisphaera mikurensis]BAM03087.1 putative aminotransferase [Phycisphaera mikurensis NBRC 102666]
MPTFQPFEQERVMSKFEFEVDYNLSESGSHPISLRELVGDDPELLETLLDTRLDYTHANGLRSLRENVSRLYPGSSADDVLITVGTVEANYNAIHSVCEPGDEIVVMMPNYLQAWGSAVNLGLDVKTFPLVEERGWAPDLDALRETVSPRTKMIAVCNPNNPTGRILTEEEMETIVEIADGVGAWLLADEVYRGAERVRDDYAPTFFGRYDKVLATGSLSKAYGLPGLRLGWVLGPQAMLDEIWARHEYTTISASMISNKLAAFALSPEVRPRIIERTRGFVRRGFPVLQQWVAEQGDTLRLTEPDAAAVAFCKYHHGIGSVELCERIREEQSVLLVPGAHFNAEGFVRISYGLPEEYLRAGLDRVATVLRSLEPAAVG